MKKLLIITLLIISSANLLSQTNTNYYVHVNRANLKTDSTTQSKVLIKLDKHSNLRIITIKGKWAKVSYGTKKGYVLARYIKKGKAIVTTYETRTGAVCRDGTSSSATGRGACSHHGGVSYWKTRKRKRVRIE